jgi:hypothetical protein
LLLVTLCPALRLVCACACASLGLESQVSSLKSLSLVLSLLSLLWVLSLSSPCPWQRAYCMYVISASVPSHWNAAISDLLPADYWDTYLTYTYTLPYLTYLPYLSTVLPRTRLHLLFLLFCLGAGSSASGLGSIYLTYLPSPHHLPSTYTLPYLTYLPYLSTVLPRTRLHLLFLLFCLGAGSSASGLGSIYLTYLPSPHHLPSTYPMSTPSRPCLHLTLSVPRPPRRTWLRRIVHRTDILSLPPPHSWTSPSGRCY